MSAAALGSISNVATLMVNLEKLEENAETEEAEGEEEEGEDDSGNELAEKPRLSKRQCSQMDNVDMRINGRYQRNGKCAYDQDTLSNSGNHPEDKTHPRQMEQHPVDSAGEASQPLTDSAPMNTFDSALELEHLLLDGNPDPTSVAAAPTVIISPLPVGDLETFLKGTAEGFAIMSPLILVALFWLVIVWTRANRQRKAARLELELMRLYPRPVVEMKGDLESGSV